ncbi:cyclin-dependent protein kinase inhibitor SMR9-like [Zingiber officinale]|uniref:cyclin-dependent protein kinase inhibitor SMR9-like n=1 Tax=Zingiber officinale TaxID=94328 RepID=UPI001C4D0397|nr:cyclin-dependent protein kinase inhibitor SMR9-like [Zingiber officinale]
MGPAFRPGRRKSHCKPYPGHFKKKKPSDDLRDGGCSRQTMPSNLEEESTVPHVAGYSTPKTKKSRIPEQLSCPPAPKKRKITTTTAASTNLHPNTSPSISFFTSPDLDLFFLYALHEII